MNKMMLKTTKMKSIITNNCLISTSEICFYKTDLCEGYTVKFSKINQMEISNCQTYTVSLPVKYLASISFGSTDRVYELASIVNHLNPGINWNWERFFWEFETKIRESILFPEIYKLRSIAATPSADDILYDSKYYRFKKKVDFQYDPVTIEPVIEKSGITDEYLKAKIRSKIDYYFGKVVLPDGIEF